MMGEKVKCKRCTKVLAVRYPNGDIVFKTKDGWQLDNPERIHCRHCGKVHVLDKTEEAPVS